MARVSIVHINKCRVSNSIHKVRLFSLIVLALLIYKQYETVFVHFSAILVKLKDSFILL